MRISALLDPEIFQMELLAVAVRPEQIGIAFARGNHVLVVDERHHPFFLGPYSRAVRIAVLSDPIVEKLDPGARRPRLQRFHVVAHFEQIAAGGTTVDDFEKTVLSRTAVDALKPGVITHGRKPFPSLRFASSMTVASLQNESRMIEDRGSIRSCHFPSSIVHPQPSVQRPPDSRIRIDP